MCNSGDTRNEQSAAAGFATRAVRAGHDPSANGHAVSTPIYASAAFDLENAVRGDALASGELSGFEYSRVANPTVDVLEKRIASLEGGIGAVAVSSGMAAVSYALMCVGEAAAASLRPPICMALRSMRLATFCRSSASMSISCGTSTISMRSRP